MMSRNYAHEGSLCSDGFCNLGALDIKRLCFFLKTYPMLLILMCKSNFICKFTASDGALQFYCPKNMYKATYYINFREVALPQALL